MRLEQIEAVQSGSAHQAAATPVIANEEVRSQLLYYGCTAQDQSSSADHFCQPVFPDQAVICQYKGSLLSSLLMTCWLEVVANRHSCYCTWLLRSEYDTKQTCHGIAQHAAAQHASSSCIQRTQRHVGQLLMCTVMSTIACEAQQMEALTLLHLAKSID